MPRKMYGNPDIQKLDVKMALEGKRYDAAKLSMQQTYDRQKQTLDDMLTSASTAAADTSSSSSSDSEKQTAVTSNNSSTSSTADEIENSWEEYKDSWNDLFSSSDSDSSSSSNNNAEEDSNNILDSVKTVGINEEFGNDTITGKVLDVDYDYNNYNDLWTTVPEDKKCVFIRIKVTNTSNETNYSQMLWLKSKMK